MLMLSKMPAKKNTNRKANGKLAAAEIKRRAAQSARDKAQASAIKPKKKAMRVASSYVPAVRAGAMSRLAMSIAAPQHVPPMRLPTVSRQKTDVKHLWNTGVYTLLKPSTGTPIYAPSRIGYVPGSSGGSGVNMFASEALPEHSALFALTRDAVTPAFVSVPVISPPTGPGWWFWIPYWPDPTSFWGQAPSLTNQWSQPVIVVFPGTATTAGETFNVSPPSHLAKVGPITVMPTGQTALDATPSNLPAARNANGELYGWHSLGDVVVEVRLMDNQGNPYNVPAGASFTTMLNLSRYKGPGTVDESTNEVSLTISPGVSSGYKTFTGLPAGYYRSNVADASYYASAGTTTLGIAYQLRIYSYYTNSTNGLYGTGIFPMTNSSIAQATYMLERSRINSASLLLQNVSSSVAKAGELWGVREAGKENFFTFLTTGVIMSLAGASGTAYYGPLAKGGYTFLEPPSTVDDLHDYALSLSGEYGGVVLPVSYLDSMSIPHVYFASWPPENAFGTSTMLTVRVDTHIEFVSNSQLATLGITSDPVSDYTDATVVLSAGSYFYENPTHLQQLWGWIKKTGANVLRAGASAAARTALEAGTLALGSLML